MGGTAFHPCLLYQRQKMAAGILYQRDSNIVGLHQQAVAAVGTVYDDTPIQPPEVAEEILQCRHCDGRFQRQF